MSPHSVEVPADPVQARGAPALFPVVQMQRQPFDCGPADVRFEQKYKYDKPGVLIALDTLHTALLLGDVFLLSL